MTFAPARQQLMLEHATPSAAKYQLSCHAWSDGMQWLQAAVVLRTARLPLELRALSRDVPLVAEARVTSCCCVAAVCSMCSNQLMV